MKLLDNFHFLAIGFSRPVLSMFLIYISYLLFGSLIFVTLETTEEQLNRNTTMKHIQATKKMIEVLRESNYSDLDIEAAFLEEQNRQEQTVDPTSVGWSQLYLEKLFFAFILITTVGYGNVSPKSQLGQMVCVIYTIFGFPINVIMMRLLSFKFRGALRMLFKKGHDFFPGSIIMLFILGFLFFLFWLTLFIFIPAYIFVLLEDWDYMKGVYFGFVSLTTIGLGDLVAGVSSVHIEGSNYYYNVLLMLIWMFFGLGFVTMAVTMLSYVMGVMTLDKLDCKCRKRTAAIKKLKVLLDLINELNWQLVKSKPEDFTDWEEIENFRNALAENPQDVTPEMLKKMFDIVFDLKEKCYNHLYGMDRANIPTSPLLEEARAKLPEVLSSEKSSAKLTFSSERQKKDNPKTSSNDSEKPVTDRQTSNEGKDPKLQGKSHPEEQLKDNLKTSTSDSENPVADSQTSEDGLQSRSQGKLHHRGKFKTSTPEAKHISDIPVKHEIEDKRDMNESSKDDSDEAEDKQDVQGGAKEEKSREEVPEPSERDENTDDKKKEKK